jgi:phosphate transport system protein
MREGFSEELEGISNQLVEMTMLVGAAMGQATTALLDADLHRAESVIAADEAVDELQHDLEERALGVLARQAPVARDLRMIVTSLRMSADLERMGDLARHVAKVARLRYPDSAVPLPLRPTIANMGQVAQRLVAKAGTVIASGDVEAARELERDDDAMDELHRALFTALMVGERSYGVESTVDVTLCGRYYERYADHAVSVAKRVVYLVTGERVAHTAG